MTTSTKFLAEKIARAERNWNGPKWQGQRNMLKPITADSTGTAVIPSEPMSAIAGGVMKDNSNYSSEWYRTDNKTPEFLEKWALLEDPFNPNNKLWMEKQYMTQDSTKGKSWYQRMTETPYWTFVPSEIKVSSAVERDKPTTTGLHYDKGKPRVDLLDPDFLLAVGNVLEYGCHKYDDHNWRGGIPISKLVGSCLRHILSINRGEDIDSESGLPHTAHLGCDSMFLHWTLKYRPDLDDRYKY